MRSLYLSTLVLTLACNRANSTNPLASDAAAFCGASKALGAAPANLASVGPYFDRELKGEEFKKLTSGLKQGTISIEQFHADASALVQRAGIAECPTLTWFQPRK